jgi:metal-responsive CopG/Arc/MetJ family transcriptional regulator
MNTIMADLTRLNYSIPDQLEKDFDNYCVLTGRKASEVIRQLICEVLDGDRELPKPAVIAEFVKSSAPHDKRTDMWIAPKILNIFDKKVDGDGYPGKSAVIAWLLSGFLASRGNHTAEEMVRVTTLIDRDTYMRLGTLGAPYGKSPEQVITELAKEYAKKTKAKG